MKIHAGATLALIAGVVTLSATLVAQSAKVPGLPTGTQLNPGGVSPGNGNFIVIGCVTREGEGSAPNFVITDGRPTPPVKYRLQGGDADLLRFHVGHTVEIGGTITGGGAQTTPTLTVKSLDYIATTCQKIATR